MQAVYRLLGLYICDKDNPHFVFSTVMVWQHILNCKWGLGENPERDVVVLKGLTETQLHMALLRLINH